MVSLRTKIVKYIKYWRAHLIMQEHNSKKDYLDSKNNMIKRMMVLGLPQRDIDILEEIKYGTNTRDG